MAKRPIFRPDPDRYPDGYPYAKEIEIEFKWYPGFSVAQAQRSIRSLHEAAESQGIAPVLEISGKSEETLGVSLSAFELPLKLPDGNSMSVECAYQGSKVFENGGPYHDLYEVKGREAKTDSRLKNSGNVVAFNFMGKECSIEPQTAFYDWLYMKALSQQESSIVEQLKRFQAYSDIAFNPKRSINCQARAAAVYVALNRRVSGAEDLICDWDSFKGLIGDATQQLSTVNDASQPRLPFFDKGDPHTPHYSA